MSKTRGKLHECLAVEGSLRNTAEKMLDEAVNAFKSKDHLYKGHKKTYKHLKDEESDERIAPDVKNVVDTVPSKLEYVQEAVINAIDCMYQKEATNTHAKSDILVDGEVIATDVPSVVLLNLETRLKAIRKMYSTAPTIDPSYTWSKDHNEDHVYISDETTTQRTKKINKPVELSPATEHHPAQVQMGSEDILVGHYTLVQKSGCLSPRDKHNYLKRIDNLINSVVKARCRANDTELKDVKVGKALFDYINKIE